MFKRVAKYQKGGKKKFLMDELYPLKPTPHSTPNTSVNIDEAKKQAQILAEAKRKKIREALASSSNPYKGFMKGNIRDRDFLEKGIMAPNPDYNPNTSFISPQKFDPNREETRTIKNEKYAKEQGLRVDERGDPKPQFNPNSKGYDLFHNAGDVVGNTAELALALDGIPQLTRAIGSKLLPNVYKANPFAFKPNPEAFYRQVDNETYQEGLLSNLIKGKQNIDMTKGEGIINLNKAFGDDAYYNKGNLYFKNNTKYPYLFEANLPENKFIPKLNGRTRNYNTENTSVRVSKEPLSINDPNVTTYQKDWLQGYKQINKPKPQDVWWNGKTYQDIPLHSEELLQNPINYFDEPAFKARNPNFNPEKYANSPDKFGTGSREITDESLRPFIEGDKTNSIFTKPLSDREKEMYKWFEEQQRFDKLPQTKNKQSLEVLENFKQRIKTPEGQQRLKELGITEKQFLNNLEIKEDLNTYGYYQLSKNKIAINPEDPLINQTTRHEIEHGVQGALFKSNWKKEGNLPNTLKRLFTDPLLKKEIIIKDNTKIDDLLSNLKLKNNPTPNKEWSGHVDKDVPVDMSELPSLLRNRQQATDYFLTGSEGKEKSAFLGEVQEYMMNTGVLPKTSYKQVTPEMVKNTFTDAMFDDKLGGTYLRLFNIMKADPANYDLISKGLNKMLIPSGVVAGAATLNKKQQGGQISKLGYKNNSPYKNNPYLDIHSPNGSITMQGVDKVLHGVDEYGNEQIMYPGQEYQFQGKHIRETPVMQQGGLWSTNRKGYVDSTLNANKNLDFVKRLYDKNPQTIQLPNEPFPSTHMMESGDGNIYPRIVNINGKLVNLGDDAWKYAQKTGEQIKFPNDNMAQWFGKNYKMGTGVLSKKQQGGVSKIKPQDIKPAYSSTTNIPKKYVEEYPENMVYPPVTVVTHKDKETRDFYKQVQEADPYSYSALMDISKKYGFPKVRTVSHNKYRSNYNPFFNTVNLRDKSYDDTNVKGVDFIDYMNELAHAKQWNQNWAGSTMKYLSKDIWNNEQDRYFNNKNTIEYEAHQILYPEIKKQFDNQTIYGTEYLPMKKQGGFVQLKKYQLAGSFNTWDIPGVNHPVNYNNTQPAYKIPEENKLKDVPSFSPINQQIQPQNPKNDFNLQYLPLFANSIATSFANRVDRNRQNQYQMQNLANPLNIMPNNNNTNDYEKHGTQIYQDGGMLEEEDDFSDWDEFEDFIFDDEEDENVIPQQPEQEQQPEEQMVSSGEDEEGLAFLQSVLEGDGDEEEANITPLPATQYNGSNQSSLPIHRNANGLVDPTSVQQTIPEVHSNLNSFFSDMNSKFNGLKITSTTGGKHMKGSRHYQGKAIDIGANSSDPVAYANFRKYIKENMSSLKQAYGAEDIIDEGDHIHIELPKGSNFRAFSTPQEGMNALVRQLKLYQTGETKNNVSPNSTLAEAMNVYAPAKENPNLNNYINFLSKKLGVTPNTPISQLNTEQWAEAISQFENSQHKNNPGGLKY